ncbi:MAG: hypothetical protein KME64_09605 [Scytonematopsis contorta HA4267-MV1]|jgi:hypothetical protein|nr:hypothetical protein [Scytonematopsis contorta HA4267-MV1]
MRKFINIIAVSSLFSLVSTVANISQMPVVASKIMLVQETATTKPIFEENNYRFELQSCQRVKEAVTCSFLMSNLGNKDREIDLYGNHNFSDVPRPQNLDYSGNEYMIKDIYIGQQRAGKDSVRSRLIPSIPKKVKVTFELPVEVDKLAVLEVIYRDNNPMTSVMYSPVSKIRFRNVDIVAPNPGTNTRITPTSRRKK